MEKPKVSKKLLNDLDSELSGFESPTKNKLTPEQVTEIRQKLADGVPQVEIAAFYEVDKSTISSIKIGKTWRNENPLDTQIMIPAGMGDAEPPEHSMVFMPNGSFRPSDRFYRQTDDEFFRVDKIEQRENGPTTLTMQPDPVITEDAYQQITAGTIMVSLSGDDDEKSLKLRELNAREEFIKNNISMLLSLPNGEDQVVEARAKIQQERAALLSTDLFGEPLPLPVSKQSLPPETFPDNIMGEDIIKIRALTGKARKNADDALRAAAVEFLAAASPECFWVPGNVASSKNNKDIGFYLKKSEKTGKMERIHVLVDSARTKKYKRDTKGYWLQNKIEFLNQTRHLPLPLHIEFTFIRDSLRAFDFINACQVLADLMGPKENSYFTDDDTVHFLPVFNPVVYYHAETPGVLFRVIKEDGRNA